LKHENFTLYSIIPQLHHIITTTKICSCTYYFQQW